MGKIKVAIIGVGNCASSLVQGIHKYVEIPDDAEVSGLMHNTIGGYRIEDIEVVAAFDIDENKVGKDLSEAIFAEPNNTLKFADVPKTGVIVERGMTHDSIGKYVAPLVKKSSHPTANIVGILKEREVDVVINYLPVGSEDATKWYVEQILNAGCGMVNCIPVFLADSRSEISQLACLGMVTRDEFFNHIPGHIVGELLWWGLHEIGARACNSAAYSPVQGQLGTTYGVHHHTG